MRPFDPRLLPHLRPARRPLAGVVAGGVLSGCLLVAQAFAVAALLTSGFAGARTGDWAGARDAAVWFAAVTIGRAGTGWLVDVLSARASAAVTTTLRRRLLEAALAPCPAGLRRRSGELGLLATRGVAAVDPYLTRYLPTLVVAAVLPPLTVLAIATQDLLSAGIVLATLPLVPVFAVLVGLATRERADRQWRALASLSGHFVDVVRGLPTLVAHRRAHAQSAAIRRVTDRYRQATRETLRLAFASSAVLETVATLSVALVAVTVGLRLSGGSMDLRTALVVLLLAPEAYWPLRRVGAEFHAAAEGTATFAAADEILSAAPGPPVHPAPLPRRAAPPTLLLDRIGVTYPGRSAPALAEISGRIPAGGVTAVVGPSGSGKSTLLSALMGLAPLTSGRVTVDGADPLAVPAAWQRQVAWVPQRPWFAAASVRDNVRLGRPEATDAEVGQALRRVGLDEVVAALPGGLDHRLGEDGAGLSAGQRARLALARVVVADRPLVLLDEPTAHLDPVSEQGVTDTLRWLAGRSTVVVVAHRDALVDLADHVLRLPGRAVAPPAPDPDRPAPVAPVAPVARVQPGPAVAATAPAVRRTGLGARLGSTLGAVLGALAAASGVALTATAGWLVARAAEHPPVLMLMVAIVGVRLFGLARPVLRYAERLVSHDVALRLLAERRAGVYDALVPLVPARLGRRRGDLLASVVDDVDSLVDRQLRVRAPLVTFGVVGALAGAFASWALPVAGLVALLTVLGGGAAAFGVARAGVGRAERRFVEQRAALSTQVLQTLQGAADLTMWQATDAALAQIDGTGAAVGRAGTRSAVAVATGRAAALLCAGAGVLGMAGLGAVPLAQARLSAPMLALLVLLPLALVEVVSPLADAGALQVRTRAADGRLAALTAAEPAVSDPALPVPLPDSPPALHVVRATARWEGGPPAFEDLGLHLEPGARVAVVGPSGSGKSTLAALLLRFLDPSRGEVELAGVPARSLLLDDVRRTVGLVDDDPHVFASTLYENVRLARPGATRGEVEQALRAVRLGAWLDDLPGGLDTMLGDGFDHVSGGERARLGMARAVLAGSPVLVLDEPTAHLDTATAEAVAADLLDAGHGRSVVWITHGTVGLDRADRVLDLGRPAARDAAPLATAPA